MVHDANGNGHPNYRDSVTFTVSSSASQPFVGVRCWQGSAFVFDSYVGYYAGSWFAQDFTLDSMYWDPASDCVVHRPPVLLRQPRSRAGGCNADLRRRPLIASLRRSGRLPFTVRATADEARLVEPGLVAIQSDPDRLRSSGWLLSAVIDRDA